MWRAAIVREEELDGSAGMEDRVPEEFKAFDGISRPGRCEAGPCRGLQVWQAEVIRRMGYS